MSLQKNLLPDPVAYMENRGHTLFGRGKYFRTDCTIHGGTNSNLSMNRETGSFNCFVCGARGGDILAFEMLETGVDFVTAAKALGAWDYQRADHAAIKRKPLPFPARDALELLAIESMLVAVAAGNVANGVVLTEADLSRVLQAAGRINVIAEACA